uniref:DUF7507 domain-containing protein n=1 Tax=Algibacter lectus TaxID=221126 RepID=UPI0024958F38
TEDPTVISYNVEDNDGNQSNDATVTIDYLPVAEDNVSDGNTVGSPAVFNIVSDDTNGDTIVASTIDLDPSTPGTQETTLVVPNEGTWSVDTSGVLTFTPEVGFTTDPTAITYTVEDAEGNTSNAANITVTYDEVPPVAEDNSVANQVTGTDAIIPNISGNDTLSDGSVVDTTSLTGNAVISLDPTDSDGDGDPLTLVVPNEGTWVYDPATDDLTFTPEAGFTNDPTPIEYTLTETQTGLSDTATVTVDYVIESPTAEDDSSLANVGGAVTIDPLVTNGGLADSDPDGELDATTVSLVAPVGATSIVTDANGDITSFAVPNEGTWSVDETTGAITFTPLTTFTEDPTVISYNVEDNDGNQSNDATVTITYIVVTTDAINDVNNTFKDVAVNGNVITNDIDAEGDLQTVSDYSPLSTEGGTIVMSPNGDYVYTPAEGFTGTDTFIYTICDDGFPQACDTATVTIKVLADPNTGVNEVIANSDTATTEAGSSVDVVVLANDIDPEGDALSITPGSVTDPVNGTIVENADGTITYTPDAGFVGEDTFTYEVCDTGSPQACDTATVTVTVDPSNGIDNDTYANDDAYNGNPNMDIAGSVLDNDTDPEGDTPTVNTIPVTGVENGTLVLNPDGTFVYTPNPDFSGTDSFVYEVCDNGVPQACDQATVYITVNPNVYPMIELLKTAVVDKGTDGRVNEGDIITYTFTVENTGDVTVSNITVSDVMLGVSNLAIISGTLDPTETGTIEFDYAITAADILAGRIENTATANGTDPYGDSVSDISDDPNDTNTTDIEGDGEADGPTVTLLRSPYLELTKDGVYADADGDNVVEVGEIITYTFTVRNTGNIDVTGLTVDDAKLGVTGLSVSPADLTPGSTGTVTYEYALTQADLDAGVVYNVATANGTTSEGPVSDESEDPTPVGPSHPAYDPTCPDCTVTPLTSPQIELRKTATIDIGRDGVVEEGDTITYTFTVVNTGNAVIEGITVTDTMLGIIDAPIVSPLLFPGQVGVYTFDYKITDADIAAGRIENTATANGIDPYGNPVADISDDPNDTDITDVEGDGEPDGPTVTVLPIPMADIVTVKDDGEATYIAGTDVVYTITVTNNGPSDAANVIVSDPLPVGVIDATWVGDNGTSGTGALTDTIDLFLDGDSITYTVTLSVPFEFTGDLINVVTVTSDTMDPNPTCADCIDVNTLEPASNIGVTKEASVESALVNDEVTFTITAQNFGPQNGTNIVIEDVLPSGYEYISHLTTSGVYDEASGLWSIDALEYNGVELLEITVKVLNATDYTNVATVLSVDQVDLYDANDSDEVTLGVVLSTTCIEVYSTFTPHNVDGINDYFTIDCIENYPKNILKIYNRWGYEVYTASGYNNTWDGVSNGPRTVNEEDKVPVGTYYYVLDLGQGDEPRIGWLYIN